MDAYVRHDEDMRGKWSSPRTFYLLFPRHEQYM